MHPRWLDRVTLIGVSLLTIGAVSVCAVVGSLALFPKNSSNDTGGNLIAVVLGQNDGAAWAWVQTERVIDPTTQDTVALRFWISSNNPDDASIVFGGPMIKYLRTCAGSGSHWDETPVTLETLSSHEQDAIISFHEYAPTQGRLDTWQENQVMSEADAKALAGAGSYVRVTSSTSRPDARTYTPGDAESVAVDSRVFDFTCSFDPDAFWSTQQGQRTFTFPTVTASTDFASKPNYQYLRRLVSFERRPGYSVTALSDPPDYSNSATTDFSSNQSWWNATKPNVLVLNQFVAVFTNASGEADQHVQLLVLGGTLALLGTLLLALGRRTLQGLARWFRARLRAETPEGNP